MIQLFQRYAKDVPGEKKEARPCEVIQLLNDMTAKGKQEKQDEA